MWKVNGLLVFGFISLISGCAMGPSLTVNYDKNQKISTLKYQTFMWLTPEKIISQPAGLNGVMKQRLDDAIEQAFIARGYQLVENEQDADFAVSYTLGSRDKIKVNSYPTTYHTGMVWGRRYYGGVATTTNTTVRQYTEGKLAIDIFDVKAKEAAWHGWGTKRISSSTDSDKTPEQRAREVVEQILVNFK